ncbi:MAG: RluA family pseudouridine synthase [Bacteroidales bacterium]
MRIHYFHTPISHIELPSKFTYPFHYKPHPLCEIAADEVLRYLESRSDWAEELSKGKMFGVLIVRTADDRIGYLASFSGNLAHRNDHSFFVPPVFDLLSPTGFFRIEEENISEINRKIEAAINNPDFILLQQQLENTVTEAKEEITATKEAFKEAKKKRELRRTQTTDSVELEEMIRESQYQKAELKRLERRWKENILVSEEKLRPHKQQIEQLKQERKTRSAQLQQQLFNSFRFLNACGEEKELCSIFEKTVQKTPPAGAGECAGPKLLQYAYLNQLTPIAMAEFWWGNSPTTEIRHHGHYYPACKGKCEPILTHMLRGLDVEENPLATQSNLQSTLEVLFEDEWLIAIHKPAGMLSVPGKNGHESVFSILRSRYPAAEGPMIVHRLDMATSGILLLAKTKEVHKQLQEQFKQRSIKKRYIALLKGSIAQPDGIIDLPLAPDIMNRPRQMVSQQNGKTAITHYHITGTVDGKTRIEFYPLTGRTHQLRIHAAHMLGLNAPIVGDELYGKKDQRMFLHAEMLEFQHPITGIRIHIEKKADF